MTCACGNVGSGMGHALKCGRVESEKWDPFYHYNEFFLRKIFFLCVKIYICHSLDIFKTSIHAPTFVLHLMFSEWYMCIICTSFLMS